MGRKSSAKDRSSAEKPPAPPAKSSRGPVTLAVVVLGVALLGVLFFWRGNDSPAQSAAAATASSEASANTGAAPAPPNQSTPPSRATGAAAQPPDVLEATTKATAALGPHKQGALPPIPFAGYAPPRPAEVVTEAFRFAAEHPEVLSYIPCFCGCEQGGHRGNHDCFVKSRAANGDVLQWEEHGVECAVCIDVATKSRQMHAAGASVSDIRAAVERDFGPRFPATKTPTPKPPAHTH
jgi:hypothetical protein